MLSSCILPPGSNDRVASFVVGPGDFVSKVEVQGSDRLEPSFEQNCRLLIGSTEHRDTLSPGTCLEGFLLVEGYRFD